MVAFVQATQSNPTAGPVSQAGDDVAVAQFLLVLLMCVLVVVLPPPATPSAAPAGMTVNAAAHTDGRSVSLTIGGEIFTLAIADDPAAWATGLAGVTDISDRGGMLFVYPSPRLRGFYMAYCLVDIDVIFLDGQGRIVAMHEMRAEPPRGDSEPYASYSRRLPRYRSGRPAQYAIELKAGSIRRLGLRVGQVIGVG